MKRKSKASNYVTRRSQITKRPPSKRLKKRRKKNLARPVKGRFPNPLRGTPRPILFILTAKRGAGKKMHFDGSNFSERARVSTFATMEAAQRKGLDLLRRFPILKGYRLRVEPNFR